jgi:Short C-terminal domain
MRRRANGRAAAVGGAAYYAAKRGAEAVPEKETPEAPVAEPSVDSSEQLKELAELREQGILTEEEFAAEKKKLLGT